MLRFRQIKNSFKSVINVNLIARDLNISKRKKEVMKNTIGIGLFLICLFNGYSAIAQPGVHIYGQKISGTSTFDVYFSFSDSVSGFTASDINASNSSVVSVSGKGRFYSAGLQAENPGLITVFLPAGAVSATQGSNQPNTISNKFTIDVQYDSAIVFWNVDSDAEWQQAGSNSTGLTIADGEAKPTGATADYSSITRTFSNKMKPQKLTFRQSPVWDNWIEVDNVGPTNAADAPIFLPVANDDYYFLGRGTSKGYHAWHSTDMINWTDHGKVTNGSSDRWATSAEYKDGRFYIIFDKPNDEDPHLYIDDNLKDGQLGTYHNMVFNDPSHGSDASLFRNDEDSLFHIIYEDWTPINAKTHSWDSPLAGHTSSPDCINGFLPHEHTPVVDHRTTPTGDTGTYKHPTGTHTYYVHKPEQDAFGDWTTIKIGSQLYLFSDFHPVGKSIRVARFTSNSIYKEFTLAGELGDGHPDPTTGFAEGQFYLITQQTKDYISPGPWVEEVEARGGVDTDADGSIDKWTDWQVIKETYDHKPGYARVVDAAPAELNLSSLPEGFGFKFEFRVTDKTSNSSVPIMDKVQMSLKSVGNTPIVLEKIVNRGSLFYLKRMAGQTSLHYVVDKSGLATFSLYNAKGVIIHSIKKHHSKTGNFSMNLKYKGAVSWCVIEYRSPGNITRNISFTK